MKIIFSRKGFDTGSGGGPSPILEGVPVSLPIPSGPSEPLRYCDLTHPFAGPMGPIVEAATGGSRLATSWAHADPALPGAPGPAALGQQGVAQSHLDNQGAGVGDVFVFWGLFRAAPGTLERGHPDLRPHHRIFGSLSVEQKIVLGENPDPEDPRLASWKRHPHVARGPGMGNNTLWVGTGRSAARADRGLRLTHLGATGPSLWQIPAWLTGTGMSYHDNADRWRQEGDVHYLQTVARGQEFVANIGDTADHAAHAWLAQINILMLEQPAAH